MAQPQHPRPRCCPPAPPPRRSRLRSISTRREVIIDGTEQLTRPYRSPPADSGHDQETTGTSGAGRSGGSIDHEHLITLRIEPPLRLSASLTMDERVRALIARKPAGIVLDVAGLLPEDDLGVLALPALARVASSEGVALVLADPSAALRERLLQLGVRDLTFAYRSEPTPTADVGTNPLADPASAPSEVPTDGLRSRTPGGGVLFEGHRTHSVRGADVGPHLPGGPRPTGPRPPQPPPDRSRGVLDPRGGARHDRR